jgi:hypothetical protein
MKTVSLKVRTEFREYLSSSSVLKKIHTHFRNHEIPLGEIPDNLQVQGDRRTLVERYYAGVNWQDPNQLSKVFQVFEDILEKMQSEISIPPFYASEDDINTLRQRFEGITRGLEKDGFPYDGRRIEFTPPPAAQLVHDAADVLEPDLFREYVERINDSVETDPALAIGSTKELIESVLKTILINTEGADFEKDDDIPKLLKKVQKALKLAPDDIDSAAKGADIIKVLLSNLGSIVIKIAELRNLYGTGHGTGKKRNGLEPRHAKLAVGAGTTLSSFLLDTFKNRTTK